MDSTEFNKIAGAGLGALLIFLLLNFFSGQIYGTREAGHGEGEEHVLAYALAVETEAGGEEAEEQQVDYAALVASADPAAGESAFRVCTACHKVEEGANAVGPHLHGVVGRDIAAVDGFAYSDTLMAMEGDWTLESLSGFLADPRGYAPGTKMAFAGIGDPQDRVNVIAYLNEADGSPVDLAEGLEPLAAAGEAGAATDAAAGAPEGQAQGEDVVGAMPGAAETSVSEGDNVGGEVTGQTIVDNTEEGADVPTSPAAETHEAEPEGEDPVAVTDPTPAAPVQEDPQAAGTPGEGADPVEGAPAAEGADENAAMPGQEAPAERVEGEDAPPQSPPGEPLPTDPQQQLSPDLRDDAAAGQQAPAAGQTQQGGGAQAPAEGQDPGAQDSGAQDSGAQAPATQQGAQAPAQAPGTQQGAQAPAPATQQEAAAQQGAGAQPAEGEEQLAAAPPAGGGDAGGVSFAGGDAAEGEKVFRRCAACHKVAEGQHGVGPSLHGVVGRDVAAADGYDYSEAMAAHEGAWTPELLSDYLENPKAVIPGTKMAFPGLKKPEDRVNVITFLNENSDSPITLE